MLQNISPPSDSYHCPNDLFFTVDGLEVYCDDTNVYLNTTGIPPHLYLDPKDLVHDQHFSAYWPLYPETYPPAYHDVCDFSTVFELPNKPNIKEYLPIVGWAFNGVPFFNPLSIDSVDPFYPPYSFDPEDLDGCLGHPQSDGIYHYHMMPPCLFGSDSNGDQPLPTVGDAATVAVSGFDKKLTQIGFAYDGFPIYGPYDDNGDLHTGLDECNGKKFNDSYAYFSTMTFPYHVGCFGQGLDTSVVWNCSTNT